MNNRVRIQKTWDDITKIWNLDENTPRDMLRGMMLTCLGPNSRYDKDLCSDLDAFIKEQFVDEKITGAISAVVKPSVMSPVNDHICPHCRNDRVSKTEKSCWRCGEKL